MRTRCHPLLGAGLALLLTISPLVVQAKRLALLVGVGQYPALPPKGQLAGPEHDVQALRDVLVSRWDFNPADVQTLVNQQATKARVLEALRALQSRSAPGDEVLVYLSGHGTSALNASLNQLPVPHGSGAFVTFDFDARQPGSTQGLIVGRTDLIPIFSALEQGGRRLWFVSDSCYSGNQARSLSFDVPDEPPARFIPLPSGRERADQAADLALANAAPAAPPYPYRTVMSLAASAESERARDISGDYLKRNPTLDGKPHGALTDALLRVLTGQLPADLNNDGLLSLNEVHRATANFMAQRTYGHTPQRHPAVAEDSIGLGNQPVLGKRGVAAALVQASVQPLRLLDDALPAPVRQALAGVPDTTWVPASNPPQHDLRITTAGNLLRMWAASGDLLATVPDTDTAKLLAQVRQVAWARRFQQLAQGHSRGVLAMDLDPAVQGGNRYFGQKIAFVVRPDKPGTLVLLNINSDGKVSVLYPTASSETRPLPAGDAVFVPGRADHLRIKVQAPEGMDLQFALLFDEPPAGLDKLFSAQEVSPDDSRVLALEAAFKAASGRFTLATSTLRSIKP